MGTSSKKKKVITYVFYNSDKALDRENFLIVFLKLGKNNYDKSEYKCICKTVYLI